MAKGKTITVVQKKLNNNSVQTVNATVEPVVIDGRLDADHHETNPGVRNDSNKGLK